MMKDYIYVCMLCDMYLEARLQCKGSSITDPEQWAFEFELFVWFTSYNTPFTFSNTIWPLSLTFRVDLRYCLCCAVEEGELSHIHIGRCISYGRMPLDVMVCLFECLSTTTSRPRFSPGTTLATSTSSASLSWWFTAIKYIGYWHIYHQIRLLANVKSSTILNQMESSVKDAGMLKHCFFFKDL